MTRLFFALDISTCDQQKIAKWRDEHMELPFKKIPWQNFHITLAFLGSISSDQQHSLISTTSEYINEQFHRLNNSINDVEQLSLVLQLDHCGWFKKPKVIYVGNAHIPCWLEELANHLSFSASHAKILQEQRSYNPHVSLYRKATSSAEQCLAVKDQALSPDISIEIKSFSLYQSISSPEGVKYIPIKNWSLL